MAFRHMEPPQVMYYNKKAFEKAGIKAEDIKSMADLEAAAKITSDKMIGWEPMGQG